MLIKSGTTVATPALVLAALTVGVPASALPYGPDTSVQGFVWREAFDGDTICVTPAFRQQMFSANGAAACRKAANQAPTRPPQPIPNNGAPPQPNAQGPGGGEIPFEDWVNRDACTPRPGARDAKARTDLCMLAPPS